MKLWVYSYFKSSFPPISCHCGAIFFFGSLYPLGIMEPFLPRHNDLSLASLSAVPHVRSIFFKSPSKVFLRVMFGLPCFLLPGGFHLKPFLGILFCSILSTCPSHLCLLCLTSKISIYFALNNSNSLLNK